MKKRNSLWLLLLLLTLVSLNDLAAQEYLLDSTTSLLFIPPSSGSVDFSKRDYDAECRMIKKRTKNYTDFITFDGNLQTSTRTDNDTGDVISIIQRKYSNDDLLLTRLVENPPNYSRIDSFFYDQEQREIGYCQYTYNQANFTLFKTTHTYEDDLLSIMTSNSYNSSGNLLSYDSTYFYYNNQEKEILRINTRTGNFQLETDTIRSFYTADNALQFEFQSRYNNGEFIFQAETEYTYVNNYKIVTREQRTSKDSPFVFNSRHELHYANELFYEFDTIREFQADFLQEQFLRVEEIYTSTLSGNEDSITVNYTLGQFNEDHILVFTGNLESRYFRKPSTTGINEKPNLAKMVCYPNPSKLGEQISIEANQLFDEVCFTNQMGQKIFSAQLYPSSAYRFSTSKFQTGIYYISLFRRGKPIAQTKKQLILE